MVMLETVDNWFYRIIVAKVKQKNKNEKTYI